MPNEEFPFDHLAMQCQYITATSLRNVNIILRLLSLTISYKYALKSDSNRNITIRIHQFS